MFFSATLDGAVGELARAYTRNPSRYEVELPIEHDSWSEADHRFIPVTADEQARDARRAARRSAGSTLVFVRTKRGADHLAQTARARTTCRPSRCTAT